METGRLLAYIGGVGAIIAGATSILARKPLVSVLLGAIGVDFVPIEGSILIVLGVIGIAGGVIAIYSSTRGDAEKTMIGGAVGLLAPCGLSLLAVIGGYLMRKQVPK